VVDVLYTAVATARGGREGEVVSDDGVLDLMLARPKELGGPGGDFTNPEQLFAAGYSACFHSALMRVAGQDKVDVEGSSITAHVGLGIWW
jgi:Ohr subfamily peroxiredoxin